VPPAYSHARKLFANGFDAGQPIVYISTDAGQPLTSVLERSTYVPALWIIGVDTRSKD